LNIVAEAASKKQKIPANHSGKTEVSILCWRASTAQSGLLSTGGARAACTASRAAAIENWASPQFVGHRADRRLEGREQADGAGLLTECG
jgi:hypothetical protein